MSPDLCYTEISTLARDLKVSLLDNSANSDAPWSRRFELVFLGKTVMAFSTPTEVLAFLKGVKHGRSAKPEPPTGSSASSTCFGVNPLSPLVILENHDWAPFWVPTGEPNISQTTPYDFCRRCGAVRVKKEYLP